MGLARSLSATLLTIAAVLFAIVFTRVIAKKRDEAFAEEES